MTLKGPVLRRTGYHYPLAPLLYWCCCIISSYCSLPSHVKTAGLENNPVSSHSNFWFKDSIWLNGLNYIKIYIIWNKDHSSMTHRLTLTYFLVFLPSVCTFSNIVANWQPSSRLYQQVWKVLFHTCLHVCKLHLCYGHSLHKQYTTEHFELVCLHDHCSKKLYCWMCLHLTCWS